MSSHPKPVIPLDRSSQSPMEALPIRQYRSRELVRMIALELKTQGALCLPLLVIDLTRFAKIAITTAFLGRLGELQLTGGTLGFTFANVTGFSVLNGLCCALEPICGQAFGAKNFKLLHKTLFMAFLLLLIVSLPISFLWINVDKILIRFGQREDTSLTAKKYLLYLLPNLAITSLLCPIKTYLSSQSVTIPTMISYGLALAFQIPINIFLTKAKGIEGVSMAICITEFIVLFLLGVYILVVEIKIGEEWKEGGWFDQSIGDWIKMLQLCVPCCLVTCLEWWCWEILVLLTGRLPNAKQAVGVIAIVLNFDYLLYSAMQSLATAASIRVSNELGASQASIAYRSAHVSLATSVISGCIGALVTVGARGIWGSLFTSDKVIIIGVKRTMLPMALLEVVNFPMVSCGGILRGTARPYLAMYANLGGFYLLALPAQIVLAFKAKLGLNGLIMGFLIGMSACLTLLIVFLVKIDWEAETINAQIRSCTNKDVVNESHKNSEVVNNPQV